MEDSFLYVNFQQKVEMLDLKMVLAKQKELLWLLELQLVLFLF